ncbi:MAG: M23 family metallopeptidase [Alphaproteobacteria bacterium]
MRCVALSPLSQAALAVAGVGLVAWVALVTVGYFVRGADLERLEPRTTLPATMVGLTPDERAQAGQDARPIAVQKISDPFEATLLLRDTLREIAMKEPALPVSGFPLADLPVSGFPLADLPVSGFPLADLPVSGPIIGRPLNGVPTVAPPRAGLRTSMRQAAVFTGPSEMLVPVAFRRERALPTVPQAPMPPLPPMRRASPTAPFPTAPVVAVDLEQLRTAFTRTLAERDPERTDLADATAVPPLEGRDAPQTFLRWLLDRASEQIEAGERILALIGLDPSRLIDGKDDDDSGASERGLGGPFVPFMADAPIRDGASLLDLAALDVRIERWSDIRRTLRQLPLGNPVSQTEIGSGYGRRVDPINGRSAFHEGIDFRGSRGTEVSVTGAGVVTFAGRRGRYGRTVEIDHGNGVSTIYAHLDRIKVNKGDIVTRRMVVGTMGATGRATGVHLHYEVRVDGQPRDPNRFVIAGRYVQSL